LEKENEELRFKLSHSMKNENEFQHNLHRIKQEFSDILTSKDNHIFQLSKEKKSVADYWLQEFEKLKEERDLH